MDDNVTYNINLERVKKQYYIDRLGNIHKYNGKLDGEILSSIHDKIAEKYYPDHDRPRDMLDKLGWITIGSTVYGKPIIYIQPNQAQINKLSDLGLYDYLLILNGDYFISYKKEYL